MYWLSRSTDSIILFMVCWHWSKCYCMCHLSLCWYSIFCKQNFVVFVFGSFHLFVDGYIAFAWFWINHIFHLELAVLSNFMARIPDKIKSIDGSRETLKLAVRITDLWFVGTPNKFEQAEMVIVDSEVCFLLFIWLLDCCSYDRLII